MRTLTLEEFFDELKAQGVPKENLAFRCPMCSTIQSAADLIGAGAGEDFDAVEKYLAFSCVGRFTGAGPATREKKGSGCDWTLGGFFRIHKLEVVNDGQRHPRFEVCTPEEAQHHAGISVSP